MDFLTSDDFKKQIKDQFLEQITEQDSTLLDRSEIAAIEEMCSYLSQRYDVEEIFSQSGDDRNPLIIQYLVDIMLYHLHSRITPRNVPQIRIDRYNTSLVWLDKVNEGVLNPALPHKNDPETGQKVPFRFGGPEKQGNLC